jgi:uncharacterized protein YbjT (DUF2867 family)
MGEGLRGKPILVTGATGYVGGRLVPRLLEAGFAVRCLARDPSRLEGRGWEGVEVVRGDVLDPSGLEAALRGAAAAYYLVHSMATGKEYPSRDREGAANFREAAGRAGVGRILYLGGLASGEAALSPHLRSRLETGEILREGPVPVTEFRASVILGSGSLSFEVIRYLTERLPVMVAPRWVSSRCQPIGIRDVLAYLTRALDRPETSGRVIEIGGADTLTYRDIMLAYAKTRGLRRKIFTVPVLTPRLSSYWLGLVTPVPSTVARELIEGVRTDSVCREASAGELFPDIRPATCAEALREAVASLEESRVETSWTQAFSPPSDRRGEAVTLRDEEGLLIEERRLRVEAAPERAFGAVSALGGDNGWYFADFLWKLRGFLDLLAGGVGMRRGRRHPTRLRPGDPVDFWRVEACAPPTLLRLRAEMKLPGRAWLEFRVLPEGPSACRIVQRALFDARGLPGLLYWYSLYPVHRVIFSGLVRAIGRRAVRDGKTCQVESRKS